MLDDENIIEITGDEEVKKVFSEILDLCYSDDDIKEKNTLIRAYNFAYDAHKGVRRKSGELYIFHPIEVARIVATDIGLGLTSMVCALLHDVVEDVEEITIEIIEKEFGAKVANIVSGLTKINTSVDTSSAQAATYRKMLMTLSDDLRVILIKLSDRLHNMRTLDAMSEKNKIVKTGETLYVYAPLARKLGLNKIGRELEDLSFKHHLPSEYKKLMQLIEQSKPQRELVLKEFKDKISGVLDNENIDYKIKVVRKSLYATWQKMNKEHLEFEDIHNFQTFRLIFKPKTTQPERLQCYHVYALVTGVFTARRRSLRDWVANPNGNGFEALIVDVMLSDGNWKEIQILSNRMSEIAERGYSSEKKIGSENQMSKRDKWIESIKDQLINLQQNDTEFIDNFRLNLYTSEIYVFTPKGDMKTLPKGSSVLDFAFQIHSDLGLHFVGAKVNKKITNHTHILKSGDQVEILSSDNVNPSEDWIQHTISPKAKQRLTSYFRKLKRQIITSGEEIFKEVIVSHKIELTQQLLAKLFKYFNCIEEEQLYYKVGKNLITRTALTKAVKSMSGNSFISSVLSGILTNVGDTSEIKKHTEFNHKKVFVLEDTLETGIWEIATCCYPIPGDSSIAYKSPDGSIVIHSTECKESIRLNSQYKTSIAQVEWDIQSVRTFRADIFIEGIDRTNMVHDLTYAISQLNINMRSLNIEEDRGIFKGDISVYIPNVVVLKTLLSNLKKIKGVKSVGRKKI